MFGHRVVLRPVRQRTERRERQHVGAVPVLTDDERFEVYTDLATLLALADTDAVRPSA